MQKKVGIGSSWICVAPPCPVTRSCLVMALPREAAMGPKHHSHPGSTKGNGNIHVFSLNQESVMLSFGGCWPCPAVCGSPHMSVPVPDDRARSFLDPAGSTRHTAQRGRGRLCAPSVKELSALYLSQTAAAADASSAQPVRTQSHPSNVPPASAVTAWERTTLPLHI